MPTEGVVVAILGAAIALGGLLLVFIGFLIATASQTGLKSKRVVVKWVAGFGMVPFTAALACSWQSILAIQKEPWSSLHLLECMKIVVFLTALYAIIATIFGLR